MTAPAGGASEKPALLRPQGLLLELYDEDSLYFVNDFLGANMMGQKTLQDGQYQLPLLSGKPSATSSPHHTHGSPLMAK